MGNSELIIIIILGIIIIYIAIYEYMNHRNSRRCPKCNSLHTAWIEEFQNDLIADKRNHTGYQMYYKCKNCSNGFIVTESREND
jgi:hypothetical protein